MCIICTIQAYIHIKTGCMAGAAPSPSKPRCCMCVRECVCVYYEAIEMGEHLPPVSERESPIAVAFLLKRERDGEWTSVCYGYGVLKNANSCMHS
jgi:hypothetical protein